jgi:NAD(P)-dependent dehydrogenase (short-subunit alcohol dehydrogenase family)
MGAIDNTKLLIVGGSSGIGAAVARRASDLGADVTVASRSPERDLPPSGARCVTLDVTDEVNLATILEHIGPFDHVVVTPGSAAPGPVRGGSMKNAQCDFGIKFWGAYAVASHARIVEGGSLTFISGVYAIRPAKGHVIASCANAAVEALARALALEFAPTRVNCISPGLVDTPLWSGMSDARRTALFETSRATLPAQRVGEPEDIAELVIGCMTNRMLTGSVLVADGGHVLV